MRTRRALPESPRRLRECLTALASHDRTHVLRVELSFAPATDAEGGTSMRLLVTHSLGVAYEEKIGPLLVQAMLDAIGAKGSEALVVEEEASEG